MRPDYFRELCARREGAQLDFKRQFYTNDEPGNGELSRDIAAMANLLPLYGGQRAHILFGVQEDAVDKTGVIVGFSHDPSWMTSENIHQKANASMSRALEFTWAVLDVDACRVAAIEILPGRRPYYALKDKGGKLRKNLAMIRVGDTTEPAPPNDIIEWHKQDNASAAREIDRIIRPRLAPNGSRRGDNPDWDFLIRNDGNAIFDVVKIVLVWSVDEDALFSACAREGFRFLKGIVRPREEPGPQATARPIRAGEFVEIRVSRPLSQMLLLAKAMLAETTDGSIPCPDAIWYAAVQTMSCEMRVTCRGLDEREEVACLHFPWKT